MIPLYLIPPLPPSAEHSKKQASVPPFSMGSPSHSPSADQQKADLRPKPCLSLALHTCRQASACWVTVGNSHLPAGLVLFLRKENSWVILKMEPKTNLASQLHFLGPEA